MFGAYLTGGVIVSVKVVQIQNLHQGGAVYVRSVGMDMSDQLPCRVLSIYKKSVLD